MKTFLRVFTVMVCGACAVAQENAVVNPKRIVEMNTALDAGGIAGLLDQARREGWNAPGIPSQWHVDHVSGPEKKTADVAARTFGRALALRLAEEGPSMQRLPPDESLHTASVRLLDLSEWVGAVEAYGNAFLAQRCLDLAAVGVARLTANLDFPMEKIDPLLARMQPAWMSPEASLRILNREANATVFTIAERGEMERVWGSGNILRRMKAEPSHDVEVEARGIVPHLRRSRAIDENLAFFKDTEAWQVQLWTLLATWDAKLHGAFVVGLELQTIPKVQAFAEFRKRIGKFPEQPVFSEAELRARERGHIDAEKAGLKVVNMEDTYGSPMAAAFALAWKRYLESEVSDVAKLPQQRHNLHADAFQAYSEVKQGKFLDKDSRVLAEEREQNKSR